VNPRKLTMAVLMVGAALTGPGAHGEEGLPSAAEAVRPVLVGTAVPDGVLETERGEETTLAAVLGGEPAVLVFYRGHW
jgi:hypothetical protein